MFHRKRDQRFIICIKKYIGVHITTSKGDDIFSADQGNYITFLKATVPHAKKKIIKKKFLIFKKSFVTWLK